MLVVGSQNININATKATAQNRYVKNVSMFLFIYVWYYMSRSSILAIYPYRVRPPVLSDALSAMSEEQYSFNSSAIVSCGTFTVTVVSSPSRKLNVTLSFISLGFL
ncbi:hypothetical protein BC679P4_00041 [Bacteroides phage BC679P4]|nr:hypothetical protein BC679P1_00041 [Bacteroides phage BC679P1]WAX05945.1 hypothetical protein BC679P4_00041 [Bacteroides phage BC679P4]